MPDVVIWLISDTKRIASFRIPAYEVLFSPQSDACGQYCGKVFNMFMKVSWRSYSVPLKFINTSLSLNKGNDDRDGVWISDLS